MISENHDATCAREMSAGSPRKCAAISGRTAWKTAGPRRSVSTVSAPEASSIVQRP